VDHERTIVRTDFSEEGDVTLLGEETEPSAERGSAPHLPRGALIDRYVIVDELGAGGMGVVYLAYDPELDRRVAVKVLLPSMVGEGRARLIREAQAIARIAHPNVVGVHDVGEVDGSVFVAMEFVEGQTLGTWLRADSRSIPEILEVFAQAGRGLAAAHAADLIHRDFKPENVLVGDDARVRVADFGLARGRGSAESISPHLHVSSSTLDEDLTEAGAVMGTPAFMAPEQLAGNTATAASDQFAFCVALYDALYGERPFSGKTLEALSISVLRGKVRDPPSNRNVPSWLRAVVLRGLKTRATDRYASMHALVRELERDPSVNRRRIAWASALGLGALGLALFAYRSGTTRERSPCAGAADDLRSVWNDERSAALATSFRETDLVYAEDTWSRVQQAIDDYAEGWATQSTEACQATHVEHSQSAPLLEHRRRCLAERLQRLDAFLTVIAEPDVAVVDRAVQGARGLPDLEGCRDTEALEAGIAPPEQESTRREVDELREALTRAEALSSAARYREQVELLEGLLERARATGYMPIIASVEHALAQAHQALGNPQGVPLLRSAFRDGLAAGDDRRAAMAALDLAYELGNQQRLHDEGQEWIGITEALLHRIGGDPKIELGVTNALAVIAMRKARYDEAQLLFERLLEIQLELDPDDPNLGTILMNVGSAYAERREFDKAQEYLQEAAEFTERTLGPMHPSMTLLWTNLAVVALLQGHYEEAGTKLERVLELQRNVLGTRHLEYARTLATMAVVERNLGDPIESERLHREALSIRREKLGPDHPEVGESLRNLAHALHDQERMEEAIELARQAQQTSERRLDSDHPEHGTNAALLSYLLAEGGHFREARTVAERAIEILDEKGRGPNASLDARVAKGQAERGLGLHTSALATLEAALAIGRANDADANTLATIRFQLAASLVAASGDAERAHGLATQALATLREASASHRRERERVQTWLSEHPWP